MEANRSTQKALKTPEENQETGLRSSLGLWLLYNSPYNSPVTWNCDHLTTVTEFWVLANEMLFYFSPSIEKTPVVDTNNLSIFFLFSKYGVLFPFFTWDYEGSCSPSQLTTNQHNLFAYLQWWVSGLRADQFLAGAGCVTLGRWHPSLSLNP